MLLGLFIATVWAGGFTLGWLANDAWHARHGRFTRVIDLRDRLAETERPAWEKISQ